MAVPLPEWGFVVLRHDGQSWVILHQDGRSLYRNADLRADEPSAARRWARTLMADLAEVTPAEMGDDADMYSIDRRDGQLVVTPVGGFRHDERGWSLTDSRGRTTHVNGAIGEDDYDAAVEWAHSINTAGREAATVTTTRGRLDLGHHET